jgi:hypothetical protein
MNQREIRILAPYVEAVRLPVHEIEAMTFEKCLELALEIGLTRFDRKDLAKHCRIHYPHFPAFMSGKRRLDRHRLFLFCMFTGCDYPLQWNELAEEKARAEYKRVSAQAIGEYIQEAMGRIAA